MENYLFKNWTTFPFKKKTFDGQMERFLKVCVVSINNPNKILDIIPIYGNDKTPGMRDVIKLIYDRERGLALDKESHELLIKIQEPILGQFEEIKSLHGALFRQFTPDEAKYGLCSENDVWKPERDDNGKVKIYGSMRVFTASYFDSDFGKYNYIHGWFPNQMYYKYYGYRYLPISNLSEPMVI